ncbi:hypothetical protein H7169_03870 [Candidatus Gracilibacteria bacterium]|nr:hypothetical protein [Candidatus Gracilibacteria bacterium]
MFRRTLITIGILSSISVSVFLANASEFSDDIFPWLSENSLTKFSNTTEFRSRDSITRGEAAKFMVNFAGLIGIEKTNTNCEFSDTDKYDLSLREFTIESCEYELFRGNNGRFLPNNTITEAQALAVVIRSAYGMQDESGKLWYSEYFSIGKDLAIITTEIMATLDKTPITREKLATWIYRIYKANSYAEESGEDLTIYESDAEGPKDCSSYETYDSNRNVCSFECKTELECKTTQDQINTELSGWSDSLDGITRDAPTGNQDSTPANTNVLYTVTAGERLILKTGKDTPEYQNLWKEVAELSPDILSNTFIEEFEVYSDPKSDIIAFVSDNDNNGKWKMSINLSIHKLSDLKQQKATLIHELAHIITLNKDQFMSPADSCMNYETMEGCTKVTAYLNTFVRKFWGTMKTATYDDKKFVSEYATSSPEEDIAESFAFYVLGSNFSDTNIKEQKMNIWNTYPELVTIRREMRNVLTSEIIRAREKR